MKCHDRLKKENYNIILKKKFQNYQHYHLERMIHMKILRVEKYYLLIKEEIYKFLLGKAYKNPTKLKIKEENNTSGK